MGEIIPRKCITNALHKNECTRTLASSDLEWVQMQEE